MRRAVTDIELLRCPRTGSRLAAEAVDALVSEEGSRYPVVDGVPILIDEQQSPFRLADYRPAEPGTDGAARPLARAARTLDRLLPPLSRNVGTCENFQALGELLRRDAGRARVLVVGGATAGVGLDDLLADPAIYFVETDVALGPRTRIVCDAHNLPFADATFDAVVCQAVLEHVLDPERVVGEIHRVLVPDGLVYSEIPFMMQVHGGAFDVTRYTLLGHRRLYRCFEELRSGMQGGPGMALAWTIWYFLRSCATTRLGRAAAYGVTRAFFSWPLLFDDWLSARPGAYDAASGTFFLGRRRATPVGDLEILASYQGAGRTSGESPADIRPT